MPRSDTKRASTRNVTIMFTDIKGFTARVSDGSRDDLAKLRSVHDRLLLPVFKHFNGKVVKTIGDAFLVRFDSPTDAVLCGVTIQEVLRQHNAFVEDEKDRMHVRVAINTGDVDVSENDVMGEPVNIAARVEAIAEPGEVFFTEAVYLSMNRKEAPCAEVGEHTFKGIPYTVRVYKVSAAPDSELTRRVNDGVRLTEAGPVIRGLDPSTPRTRRTLLPLGMAAVVILACIGAFMALPPSASERARTDAAAAMATNDGATALVSLDAVLSKENDHPELKTMALEAATMHVDYLRESVGYAKALKWLREQLRSKTYLEPLRRREVVLEAEQLAATFVDTEDDPWPKLRELANQDPDDWQVPLAAARILEGKVFPAGPMNLYKMALDRGYTDDDDRIFSYCIRLFQYHYPTAGVRAGHSLLKNHFNEKRITWAREQFARSESGMILRNAHHILSSTSDPLLADPWHAAVYDMLGGFENEMAADAALAYFKAQKDTSERKRLVKLHRWVLDPPRGVGWSYRHKDLIRRNLEALEEEWNLKPETAPDASP